jgi:uncharacterized membrane protein
MRKWFPVLPIILTIGFSIAVYRQLPAVMATHWGANGQANGWTSRPVGAFIIPLIMLALWGIMRGVPTIDPRAANYAKFPETYDFVINGVINLMAVLHVAVLGVGLGWTIPMRAVALTILGLMFMGIGNVLPRARSNWFFGIRTPWTLSSDAVWGRTHRMAGYLMSAAGLTCMGAIALPAAWTAVVVLAATFGAAIGSIAYSYAVWRAEPRA